MAKVNLEINEENFPSNSNSLKQEKREIEKVTTGEVVRRKPGLGRKFADTFFGDDIADVKSYILFDILVPSIKDAIVDVVTNGISMMLGVSPRSRKGGERKKYTNYANVSYRNSDKERDRSEPRRRRSVDVDDIVVATRGEAEDVIFRLDDLCQEYGMARVADLYDLVGETGDFTSEKWGWESVATAKARRVNGGYLIDLPRPVYLE